MTTTFITKECPDCNRTGKVWHFRRGGKNNEGWAETCSECAGTGVVQCDVNGEGGDAEFFDDDYEAWP